MRRFGNSGDSTVAGTNSTKHVVRMLTFQPGKLLKQVPVAQTLMMKVGKFVGEMDRVLKVSLTDTLNVTITINIAYCIKIILSRKIKF